MKRADTFRVEDIDRAVKALEAGGVKLLDERTSTIFNDANHPLAGLRGRRKIMLIRPTYAKVNLGAINAMSPGLRRACRPQVRGGQSQRIRPRQRDGGPAAIEAGATFVAVAIPRKPCS